MKSKELAKQGIVDGKTLKEWADAPHGAFAKAVREKVDPYFGLENEEEAPLRKYSVEVRYSYVPVPEVEHASISYEVEAVTPEDAVERAQELWDKAEGDFEDGEDHEITSFCVPVLLP